MNDGTRDDRTVYVRNLDSKVTEEILFELFLQAGPLLGVKRPKDQDGNQRPFAFVEFEHDVSPPYAVRLMDGLRLYDRNISVQFRSGSKHADFSCQNSPSSTPPTYRTPHGSTTTNGIRSYQTPPMVQRSVSAPYGTLLAPLLREPTIPMPQGHPGLPSSSSMMGNFLIPNVPRGLLQMPHFQMMPQLVSTQPAMLSNYGNHDTSSDQKSSQDRRSQTSSSSEESHYHRHDHRGQGRSHGSGSSHVGSSDSRNHDYGYRSDRRQYDDDRKHGSSAHRQQTYSNHRHDRSDHPYRR